ncbi:DUF1848 family protein [Desulfothermobacter acidiphilus]|uniref:DUF1848 family protein n=1 Tax=Desulfothermobacter acidiphilus TaxID=1938353 RepID=UPI003F8CB3EB
MRVVVSLSRRTEPYFYSESLGAALLRRYPPERVHTVVVWTKFPATVLVRWRQILSRYEQVFLHLTVTGFGGSVIEPGVPPAEEALAALPELLAFLGDPRRLRLRPDPLATFCRGEEVYSNLHLVPEIIKEAAALGVKSFSSSFMTLYPKVEERLKREGFSFMAPGEEEKRRIWSNLERVAREAGAELFACCVPDLPKSRCIDGYQLALLHPRQEPCRTDEAAGQRELCGCTHAVDLGWYTMKCPAGCLYCYGSPLRSRKA